MFCSYPIPAADQLVSGTGPVTCPILDDTYSRGWNARSPAKQRFLSTLQLRVAIDVFASQPILKLRKPQTKKNAYDELEPCYSFWSSIVADRCLIELLFPSGNGGRRRRYFRFGFNRIFIEREPGKRDRQHRLCIHEYDPQRKSPNLNWPNSNNCQWIMGWGAYR